MSKINSKNILLRKSAQVIGASQTAIPVSIDYAVDAFMARRQRILYQVEAVTAADAISLILQTKLPEGPWVNVKTVSVTANAEAYLLFNERLTGDEDESPLGSLCRLVITTGIGDAVTVSKLKVGACD
jgi:hypothetical protein